MPLYDFECPRGHRFEKAVPIAQRDEPVPCEGTEADGPCALDATRIAIGHSHPAALLEYGLARNRDLAREGRYNPHAPSRRGVRR